MDVTLQPILAPQEIGQARNRQRVDCVVLDRVFSAERHLREGHDVDDLIRSLGFH